MDEKLKNITEEDLFLFVHHPDILDANKKVLIDINKKIFENELDFISCFNFSVEDDQESSNKELVNLELIRKDESEKKYRLAAKSGVDNSNSKTFVDEDQKYLVKIFKGEPENKLVLFSKLKVIGKKFRITLLPANYSVTITNVDEVVNFNSDTNVESIKLEVIRNLL